MIKFKRPTRAPDPALTSRSPLRRYLSLPRATPLAARLPRGALVLGAWVVNVGGWDTTVRAICTGKRVVFTTFI